MSLVLKLLFMWIYSTLVPRKWSSFPHCAQCLTGSAYRVYEFSNLQTIVCRRDARNKSSLMNSQSSFISFQKLQIGYGLNQRTSHSLPRQLLGHHTTTEGSWPRLEFPRRYLVAIRHESGQFKAQGHLHAWNEICTAVLSTWKRKSLWICTHSPALDYSILLLLVIGFAIHNDMYGRWLHLLY